MNRLVRRTSAVLLAGMTVALVAAPVISGAAPSAEATRCGGPENSVRAEFDLQEARDLWKVFPAMLRAPELETNIEPAHVVVFADNFDTSGLGFGHAQTAPVLTSVVCVIPSGGQPILYTDVRESGERIP